MGGGGSSSPGSGALAIWFGGISWQRDYPILAHELVAAGFGASKGSRTVGGAVGKARCSPDSTLRTEELVVREGQVDVLHSLSCPSPLSALPDNL